MRSRAKKSEMIDISGRQFDYWSVISYQKNGMWLCRCKCGKESIIAGRALRKGLSKGCRSCRKYHAKYSKSKLDLVGHIFGNWSVIGRSENTSKNGSRLWECRCLCGSIKYLPTGNLRSGRTKSCKRCANIKGTIHESAIRHCMAGYRSAAHKRGYKWDLTIEQFKEITSSNCFYTGLPPSNIFKTKAGGVYIFNGIDRIDSTKGYLIDNCVPCNGKVNAMKMAMNYGEFIQICALITKHMADKNLMGISKNKLKAV